MEATVTVFKVSPVSGSKVAESEARKIEPLSEIVTWVAFAAWSPAKGAEAEGREVVIVSLTETKDAAKVWFVKTRKTPPKRRQKKVLNKILDFLMYK